MARSPGLIMPASLTAYNQETLVIPLPRKNQPSRRNDGNNHPLPNPHPAAASSFLSSRQNRQRANRTARKRRTCRRPSTHPPLAFAQSSGNQLDQISLACSLRTRFSATKVSATPP